VESAFAAGKDVEVIVVDDASKDETANVCRGLEGIKYLRLEQNQGVAGARNEGVHASSSEYIALLDDDDQRLAGSIDHQVSALADSEAALMYGQAILGGALDRVAIGS
jgi:glycosyltransferase involved in cell wall biosynthesis